MSKTRITEKIFNAVKKLTAGGATINECADYFNISPATVSRIRTVETFADYHKARKPAKKKEPEIKMEEPAKQYANPTVVKLEATHYMMQELQRTNELLTGISAKLAQIVSDLYGVK